MQQGIQDLAGIKRRFAAIFLLFTAVLTTGSLFYYRSYRNHLLQDTKVTLLAIESLKLEQLAYWREQRSVTTESLLDTPFFSKYLERYAADRSDREAADMILRRLRPFVAHNRYTYAALLSAEGRPLLSSGGKLKEVCPEARRLVALAAVTGRPEMGEFYSAGTGSDPHVDLVTRAAGKGGRAVFLLLRMAPSDFLYPLLRRWPSATRSAETLLARRDGDRVVFLNRLRHKAGEPLTFTLPIDTPELLAAQGLKGKTGVLYGNDYRGVKCIGAVSRVPGTAWIMVTKMDLAEAMYGAARVGVLLLLLLAALLGGGWAWVFLALRRQMEAYERAYAEVRANYELLASKASDCILVVDMEQRRVLEANPKACETYGYTPEEMRGLRAEAVIPAEDRPAFEERISEDIRAGSRIYEARHRRKNGEVFPVEISSSIVSSPAGSQMFVIVRDISERRRAEAEIREREAVFNQFMEHSPVYVFFKDENIRSMHLSRNYEAMLGRPLVELLGKNMFELFPGELARGMVEDDKRILREGREVVVLEEFNGRKYRTIKFPIDIPGKPRCLAGYTIDITEQESFKEKLARLNERLTLAARAGGLGVWDWDIKTNLLAWDDRMYELYGLRREDFSGAYEAWLQAVHPDDKVRSEEATRQALSGEKAYDTEFRIVLPGGEVRHIRASADVFRGADGEPARMVGVNQDITGQKVAELKLRDNEERLRVTLEETQIGTWDWDVVSDVWSASPTYFTMLGYEPQAGPSDRKVWLERVHPDDREMVSSRIKEVLAGSKGKYQYEARMRHADGSYRWHAVLGTAVKSGADGKPARLIGVRMDVTGRRRSEEINSARVRLLQYAASHTLDELLEETLNEAERLTGSQIGFYHFVDEDQKSLTLQNWSTATKARFCKAEGKGRHYDMAKAGVWVDCFYRKAPVIHNDYASLPDKKGLPEGHAHVRRELVVPVLRRGGVTAILGVGNKETDYAQADVRAVSLLADLAWEIAERKMAEQALLQSSLLMRRTQALARIGGWEWDLENNTMHWTDEMFRIHGIAPGALREGAEAHIAETQKCYTQEDLPAVMAALNKCVETGDPYDLELPFTAFDGRRLWVRTTGQAEKREGRVSKIVGTLADITEQKAARAALAESEARFRTLFETMEEGFATHEIICDGSGVPVDYRFLDVNPAFERMTGLKRENLVGRRVLEVLPGTERSWIDAYGKVALTGKPLHMENFSAALGKWFEISAFSPEPGRFAVSFFDITSRRNAELETERLNRELASRNREMENFLYITTHDLRSPLVNIQGFSRNMDRYLNDLRGEVAVLPVTPEAKAGIERLAGQKMPEALEYVLSSSRRMDALITALLKVSRVGRVEMRPELVDAGALLARLGDSMRFQLQQAGAELKAGALPSCWADPGAVSQVFSNLLDNAVKYRDEGRRLVVEVSGELAGGRAVYLVADNGPGIPERDMEKIWNVFYSQERKSEKRGEGIGLAMVRRLVEKNGGSVTAESREGRGTVFRIELPAGEGR